MISDRGIFEIEDFSFKLLSGQLQAAGLLTPETAVVAELKGKIDGLYDRWLEESLRFLADRNLLVYNEGSVTLPENIDVRSVWQAWDQQKVAWLQNAQTKSMAALVEACMKALPEILTGKAPATDIIFPNSSMELVEGIYKNNTLSDYYNEVLADTLLVYIQKRIEHNPEVKLRILEIGAGTGGTSAMVFAKIKPFRDHIQEYCYTDISKAFLFHAQKTYGPGNPYLTYQLFNVENPIAGQNIDKGAYDIVIATNVLHATRNIRKTLRNAKAALRKNGLLLLNEMSDKSLLSHLTFGLLEGWWRYDDAVLRIPGCPGLYPESWQNVLQSEGFGAIIFPAQARHELGQQVIAAQSDGVVRQEQLPKAQAAPEKKENRKETKKEIKSDTTVHNISGYIKQTITEKLAESLKVEKNAISSDESFADYGIDSIVGVHLVQKINEALQINMETTTLFSYATVDQLSEYIIAEYGTAISDIGASTNEGMDRDTEIDDAKHRADDPPKPLSKRKSVPASDDKHHGISSNDKDGNPFFKEPIAIIGMSGRFAKSDNVQELWTHLADGVDLVGEVQRWDLSTYFPGQDNDRCLYGSFLEDIDRFDPQFFNISGLEATYMDPQQRLFLEESWKALEDAGYAGDSVRSYNCGVYVGCNKGDYSELFDDTMPAQAFWGNAESVVPARIAYFLDLQGPAVTINTACSSSLVAIHLACQGLWAQETQMALAGAVFVQSTPFSSLYTGKTGMLSPTGRCHAFDANADGFVPAEGVGVVVLKRLDDALDAGDHIYGVIRGSGLNQDGTTSGITAPSAKSQERLIRQVYDKFNIHPEQIQMVEAHGTGTKLGDPIEFGALTKAFRKDTGKKQYCAIGSIKTNIGHTMTAAGMAGLIKILLSLQHKKIPPSLHFQSGNPHIKFDESPFFVNTDLTDWDIEPHKKRLAVVSAFGFSGTNAHMVIEEAPAMPRNATEKPGYLIVLSARTAEQLRVQVEQLVAYCQMHKGLSCGDMSYTLLLGRRHFVHRLSCVVRSRQDLIDLLKQWLDQKDPLKVYVSNPDKDNHKEQPGLKQFGNQCIENCLKTENVDQYFDHLNTIADLYHQGFALNFDRLFSAEKYQRMSLPTYPFAREHYWVQESDHRGINAKSTGTTAVLHPMVHQNTSNVSGPRYSSVFSGSEFFLADHKIGGQRLLPGVAYLEMAREAVVQATEAFDPNHTIRLKNIAWVRPVVVNGNATRVHIDLIPDADNQLSYAIYSEAAPDDGSDTEPIVHSQGVAELGTVGDRPLVDVAALQAACRQARYTPEQCYALFNRTGIEYGPGHQSIEALYAGKGQVLAKLSLPEIVADTKAQYILHPSIMDGALQALFGLTADTTGDNAAPKPMVPFALNELEILDASPSQAWAWIRYSNGNGGGDNLQKLDIDLCDEKGKLCVRMKGFSSRTLDAETAASNVETLMLVPEWKSTPVKVAAQGYAYGRHIVVLCEPQGNLEESLKAKISDARIVSLQSEENDIADRYRACAAQLFEQLQAIIQSKPRENILVQVVIRAQGERQLFSGLGGMLKTAHIENPKLFGQIIEVDADEAANALAAKLEDNSQTPHDRHIRYRTGVRQVHDYREIKELEPFTELAWQDNGVYLITGGAGGVGRIFAREIARQGKDVTLILTGRSAPASSIQKQMDTLVQLGATVEYRQADVADQEAVKELIEHITGRYGTLNGIVHSAGVIRDNFILNKTHAELTEVLAPKVAGVVNLDQATKDVALDFMVLFSAMAAVLGNHGQADYACANAFMDAFAAQRNDQVAGARRHGRTLSINWPLWQDGGMHVDVRTAKMMGQSIGMTALPAENGIKAFYQALSSGQHQVMVIEGDSKQMRYALLQKGKDAHSPQAAFAKDIDTADAASEADLPHEKASHYLKKLLSSTIRLPLNRIDADAPLEKYGIDSLMAMQMTTELEKTFGSLPKTLFFEYQNISELTGYFLESHAQQLGTLLNPAPEVQDKVQETVTEKLPPQRVAALHRRPRFASVAVKEQTTQALDIAIIGLSGRYPQARNIHQYWKNLKEGRDCITEIPPSRWDHSLYFDADKTKSGKTYGKWGGFIDGVDEFDPLFFNISPLEAQYLDPQDRLFLQCVFETLEDAGYTRQALGVRHQGVRLAGQVGVYCGVMYEEYQLYGAQRTVVGQPIALAGNPASIANRVSYYCDFHGPSMAVDTMCSSSLTTIHLACQSLKTGGCDLAIAGGVNVSIHPNKYLLLGQGKFISGKGRCESFGQGGDGYVPGEGVGAVLLKPLSKAIDDRDHIYGVIKATAINHGGKTNGYTVPNPNAQADVILQAFEQAGLDPATISYVEAHGTGTSLGDPIEIAALNKAFRQHTQDTQFCAIGSAKSNIGHCESAAGIAGVTKVLLQMANGQIAPSLHSKVLNPNIDFENSPFVVQQELAEWKRPTIAVNGEKNEYPRIAGISSFGAGGANAHVIIEEYIAKNRPTNQNDQSIVISSCKPAIIVLSARKAEQIDEQVRRLLAHIRQASLSDQDLADMAYTLQVGREALEERLAFMAGSMQQLEETLEALVQGETDIDDVYRGQVKRNKEALAVFAADEDLQKAVAAWIAKGKYTKILDLWVKGMIFDWNKLYGDVKPHRISLPAYPFARERYWVPETARQIDSVNDAGTTAALHPLVHQNTSDLSEQRYSSVFSGQEFFLADHVVGGQHVLPAVAYLEMAREAVTQAGGAMVNGHAIRFKDIAWMRPISVNGSPAQVHIGLFPDADDRLSYEIYMDPEKASGSDGEPIVHSQGLVELGSVQDRPSVDLSALQAACGQNVFTSEQCYALYSRMGIEYGPGHRGIEALYAGQDQVLAKLSLPASISDTKAQYTLHPSIMDSALQAGIGLMLEAADTMPDGQGSMQPLLPFALNELEIYDSSPTSAWAWIHHSNGHRVGDSVQKLDIDLCDDQGRLCVRMKGFTSRVLEQASVAGNNIRARPSDSPSHLAAGRTMLAPVWDTVVLQKNQTVFPSDQHILIIGGDNEQQQAIQQLHPSAQISDIQLEDTIAVMVRKVQSCTSIDYIVWIAPYHANVSYETDALIEEQEVGVMSCFRLIKALDQSGYGTRPLDWHVVTTQSQWIDPGDPVNPGHASIHGLVGSMAKEYTNWHIRLIDMPAEGVWPMEELFILPADPQGDAWVYRDKAWYRQQLISVHLPESDQGLYKNGGVYVVIGGAGGIGAAWSEYMLRTYQAQIIWIGRRPKDGAIEKRIADLSAYGPAPEYIAADAADPNALEAAYREIKARYITIHGVIHSAIVLLDQSLKKMDEQRFKAALCAKVDVSVRLAQVFSQEPLDFVLFFSSLQSYSKAAGQSNYAAGCTFKDAFAHQLSRQWDCRVKVMNWGYWGSTGVVSSEPYRQRMAQLGLGSIEPREGMAALETLLASPMDQIVFIKTTKPIAIEGIQTGESITVYPDTDAPTGIDLKAFIKSKLRAAPIPSKQSEQVKSIEEQS